MKVRVLYHDHCFDGAASAAYMTRFLQGCFYPDAQFFYTGLAHIANQSFEDNLFDGDINAIVDFKYASNANLTWWFDHHQSAFLSPGDAEHFHRDTSGQKFLDTSYRSCTKFIASVVRDKFGFSAGDLDELVQWADIVDGAAYRTVQEAVDLVAPAMQLTLVIEGSTGPLLVQKIIRLMQTENLEHIMAQPDIQAEFKVLLERHQNNINIIRAASSFDRGVISFDLVNQGIDGYNKFIPYYLFPDSIYSVSVSTSTLRTKVSVGSNPWVKEKLRHNLATICERYGGGGHPKVGAISFPIGAVEQARLVAEEIQAELKT